MKEAKEEKINIKGFLIKYIIVFILLILVSIIVFINLNRVIMFGNVFGSFLSFFKIFGVILFFISLIISLIYHIIILTYIFFKYLNDKINFEKIIKFDKKIDVLNFTFKCLTTILFIMIFVSTPCTVIGASMEKTFYEGENVLCVNYFFSEPNDGDVIVFESKEESFYIKRVVAKSNDKIKYDNINFILYINDKELHDLNDNKQDIFKDDYKRITASIGIDDSTLEFVVPNNKYLVLGDNRNQSLDSRKFGFIDKKSIFGKVVLRFYPFNKFNTF